MDNKLLAGKHLARRSCIPRTYPQEGTQLALAEYMNEDNSKNDTEGCARRAQIVLDECKLHHPFSRS